MFKGKIDKVARKFSKGFASLKVIKDGFQKLLHILLILKIFITCSETEQVAVGDKQARLAPR